MSWRIVEGDCVERLAELDADSVDAVVCDPPYGLDFMGKDWDRFVRSFQAWTEAWAREALRVLKPGGHLLAFGGTRTYHRLAAGVEDAGFEIRDCIAWMYGSGFPKSLDVSKAIDAAAGVERTEVVGVKPGHEDFIDRTDAHSAGGRSGGWDRDWRADPEAVLRSHQLLAPATPEAERWDGWGTALKPAFEPIVVARKPFTGTVAGNVLAHGTGALNIEACRIPVEDRDEYERNHSGDRGHDGTRDADERGSTDMRMGGGSAAGARWPANVILDPEAGEYAPVAEARIAWWAEHPEGVELVAALAAESVRRKVADAGQVSLFD